MNHRPVRASARIKLFARWSHLIGGVGLVLALCVPTLARANEAVDCAAGSGTLLIGHAVSAPVFKHGQFKKGVELSHTHVRLMDSAGRSYDVAIDNVFATGYVKNMKTVPAPLNAIASGDRLEACGAPFPGGIHWVHTNCGNVPTPQSPNGWIKKIQPDGSASVNFEGGQTYCSLWPRH